MNLGVHVCQRQTRVLVTLGSKNHAISQVCERFVSG